MSNQHGSPQHSIIALYTQLASNPDDDFGWDKGLKNAINHGYKQEWIDALDDSIWKYCAAVGNPFNSADIRPGESILDIGCGAGVDLCVASLLTGNNGMVTGIDITPAMVELSRNNAQRCKLDNISVIESSIEQLPLNDDSYNVIISNGAINLAADKQNVFNDIYRVLKPGGRLYFADMIKTDTTNATCCSPDSWADCVAGTLVCEELLEIIKSAGLANAERVSLTHYKTSAATTGAIFKATKD